MENEVLVATEKSGMPLWLKGVIAVGTIGLAVGVTFGIRAIKKHRAAKKASDTESHED